MKVAIVGGGGVISRSKIIAMLGQLSVSEAIEIVEHVTGQSDVVMVSTDKIIKGVGCVEFDDIPEWRELIKQYRNVAHVELSKQPMFSPHHHKEKQHMRAMARQVHQLTKRGK